MEEDIKRTLRNILEFIGEDPKWAEYAQLQTWLKQLIERNSK